MNEEKLLSEWRDEFADLFGRFVDAEKIVYGIDGCVRIAIETILEKATSRGEQ